MEQQKKHLEELSSHLKKEQSLLDSLMKIHNEKVEKTAKAIAAEEETAKQFQQLKSNFTNNTIDRQQLKLGELIGTGGFGEVYKGTLLNAPVAVKKLSGELSGRLLEVFQQEVGILRNLNHPHVVQFLG